MNIKTVYKYIRPDGGTTVSPTCPEQECQTLYRIVAGDGLCIQKNNGELLRSIDVEDVTGWVEEVIPSAKVIKPLVEKREGIPDNPEETSTDEETPTFEAQTSAEAIHQSFVLNQEEYLEWKDYKSRVSALEFQISLITSHLANMVSH